MYAENWNNFPEIKAGDVVRITWDEKFYGNQETGEAVESDGKIGVIFQDKVIFVDALRSNEHIERTEIISSKK